MKSIFYYFFLFCHKFLVQFLKNYRVDVIQNTNGSCAELLSRIVAVVLRNCLFSIYKTKASQSVVGVATR